MKRILKIFVWVVIIAYIVVVPGFVVDRSEKTPCNSIDISLPDSLTSRFVTQDDILNVINKLDNQVLGYPIGTLNTREIEIRLALHPTLKKVEVYKTIGGKLHIEAIQRVPVVRIINNKGMSYYIDSEGAVIPFSEKFTPRVLIASGYINEPEEIMQELMIKNIDSDNIIKQIHELGCFISSHDFWKAQIEQIYVNKKGEFELVPRVGAYRIIFGGFDGYQEKFRKLYALFEKGLNKVGWNKYEVINLKFEGQIVCTKRTY
jgi:cell division protein FtsQ